MNTGLTLARVAIAAIASRRIVKFSTDTAGDDNVDQAAAATDLLIGVSAPNIEVAAGGRVDVIVDGLVEVCAGGNVTRGQPVTSDADGKAVACAPAAGAVAQSIGTAMQSAAAGDFFLVKLGRSQVTTPA